MEMIQVNQLPAQTWNWLGMNYAEIEAFPCEAFSDISTFEAAEGKKKEYRICFEYGGGREFARQEFLAKEGSELTVYQYLDSPAKEMGQRRGLQTILSAREGAKIKLIQVISDKSCGEILNDINAVMEDGASLELYQVFLGNNRIVSGESVQLLGRKSSFSAQVVYDLAEGARLDLNLVSKQEGKKTKTEMDIKGVLRKGTEKILRATIDFVKGCSGSTGDEREEVLLLDSDVENKTIPLILCGEEDVEGAHGATIGRLDETNLFYLTSRGIPEEKVYELVANARMEALLQKIGDAETMERVRQKRGQKDE